MKEMPLICPACRKLFAPEKREGIIICPGCRMPIDLGTKCPKCGDEMVLRRDWSVAGAEEYVCAGCFHTMAPYELYDSK